MCVMMFVSMQREQPGTSVEAGNRERGETHVRAGATRACLPDTAGLEQTPLYIGGKRVICCQLRISQCFD